MDILKETEKIYPEIVAIRRHFHMHPELSECETETAAFVAAKLEEYGIPYTAHVAGVNGIVAQIGHGNHAVGIRADMDALPVTEATGLEYCSQNPGVMHACGHDMHTAMLLGTGKLLKGIEAEIDAMDGAVKLFFQPAEETIGGAEPMIQAGFLENPQVERVFSLHVDPNYPVGSIVLKYGPMNAQTQGFTIHAEGVSCHGAHPEGGVDAIVMASEIVLALQTISSRYNAPTTPVIVTVGTFNSGTASNIVSGESILTGTMRALRGEVMERNMKLVETLVDGIGKAYGGHAWVEWADDFYPALINDDKVTATVEQVAAELLGKDKINFMPEPSLGADDFAFFTRAVPGTYFNVGTAVEGQPFYSLHNEHYAPAEEALKVGMAMEVASALRLLSEICG